MEVNAVPRNEKCFLTQVMPRRRRTVRHSARVLCCATRRTKLNFSRFTELLLRRDITFFTLSIFISSGFNFDQNTSGPINRDTQIENFLTSYKLQFKLCVNTRSTYLYGRKLLHFSVPLIIQLILHKYSDYLNNAVICWRMR